MMGIYIKGMEMPEKIEPGLVIEFAEGIDGKRYARLHHYRYGGLTDWLEAFPVPKHGRLIDGDVAEGIYFTEEDENGKDFCDGILYAADWISEQPTIIPAEPTKEET